MNNIHFIGFDVHKKSISYCVKTAAGEIVEEGTIAAERKVLRAWAAARRQPWRGALEATLFSGWIYDTLKAYSEGLEMAHPAKMKAISSGKKKSDAIDARTIADLLRCNLLPACYVATPRIRELRRLLRYRSLVVSEAVRMKNKMAGLLMETGAEYVKEKLHGKKYFATLLEELEEVPESVIDLLRLSRGALEMFESTQRRLIQELLADAELRERVERSEEHSGGGRDHGLDLGAGDRRSQALRFGWGGDELLRADGGAEVVGGQAAAGADLQAAQPLAADHVDRGGQAGAALEPATGCAARARTGARTSQPRHAGRGPQTRQLSAGCRQEWPVLPGARALGGADTKSCLRRKNFAPNGDRPAVPRQPRDWAEELRLPMLLTVCIEAGRTTLTHTSWTGLALGSRKWMSGQAAALAALNDRRPLANPTPSSSLRGPAPPSARRPPSPLDFYLSWMSPVPPFHSFVFVRHDEPPRMKWSSATPVKEPRNSDDKPQVIAFVSAITVRGGHRSFDMDRLFQLSPAPPSTTSSFYCSAAPARRPAAHAAVAASIAHHDRAAGATTRSVAHVIHATHRVRRVIQPAVLQAGHGRMICRPRMCLRLRHPP